MQKLDLDSLARWDSRRRDLIVSKKINEIISHLQGQGESNAQPTQERDCGDVCSACGQYVTDTALKAFLKTPNSDKGDE